MSPTISFQKHGRVLHLVYEPQNDDTWIHEKFKRQEELLLKGTFHLTQSDLVPGSEEEDSGTPSFHFQIATEKDGYYVFDSEILALDYPLLIHKSANITRKWFTAERKVSIFQVLSDLEPSRIVIGGSEQDAIPIEEYERLIVRFPTDIELRKYVRARVGAVIREYADTKIDPERAYRRYVEKRLQRQPRQIQRAFIDIDHKKFSVTLARLERILATEESFSESAWQKEILQIILLLNPKYIRAIEKVAIRDLDAHKARELDIMLVDVSGNIDLIEIKKPFDRAVITAGRYRDNFIPMRELSGSVMQIEKYIYYLNRWGQTGEEVLTERYKADFPSDFKLRITNPSGLIIMGRDHNLSVEQRHDFEVVKRKYRNVVDIITYDDLIRRLRFLLEQLAKEKATDSKGQRRRPQNKVKRPRGPQRLRGR